MKAIWAIEPGDRINLGGEHFRIDSVGKFRKGVFLELSEVPAKKPVKVFKRAFPKTEQRHI